MRKYYVQLPVVGAISVEVDATSKEEAINKAFDIEWVAHVESEGGVEIDELESTTAVVEGNVFYGPLNKPNAELIDGDEE